MAHAKVVKAMKDYPQFGINKGDQHYVWSMKRQRGGITLRSLKSPRPSQLTENSFRQPLYSATEQFEDAVQVASCFADLESAREDFIGELTNLSEEQDEKFNNMPEGLQQGDTGQLLENRRDEVQSMIDELEGIEIPSDEDVNADLEIEDGDLDATVDEKKKEAFDGKLQETKDELTGVSYNGD